MRAHFSGTVAVQTQALQLALNLSDIVTEGKGSMHHSRPIEHGGRVPGNSYLNASNPLQLGRPRRVPMASRPSSRADGESSFA